MEFVKNSVKTLLTKMHNIVLVFLFWKLRFTNRNKYSLNKEKCDTSPKQALLEEHHCDSCLCKNPGLVAILLGKGGNGGSIGYIETKVEETSKHHNPYEALIKKDFIVITSTFDFGMKLTRDYLQKCRNPSFLNKQVKYIDEHYQKVVAKLNKVKDNLIARYEKSNSSSKLQPDDPIVENPGSRVHCLGCLCNNTNLMTILRDNGTLSNSRSLTKLKEERPVESQQSPALAIAIKDPISNGYGPHETVFMASSVQFGLSFTREYLEKCRDPVFLNEQVELIKEEGQEERMKLSKLKLSLKNMQGTYTKMLSDQAFNHIY